MYFPVFVGSALLHLLAAHPKVVALFGIAGTVALLMSPHGPGSYRGTAQISETAPIASEYRNRAERAVATMLEAARPEDIEAAVEHALSVCGPGCTDLSTPLVMRDKELLRRVLVLSDLDKRVEAARRITTAPAVAVNP
jgi:hypothetical protein